MLVVSQEGHKDLTIRLICTVLTVSSAVTPDSPLTADSNLTAVLTQVVSLQVNSSSRQPAIIITFFWSKSRCVQSTPGGPEEGSALLLWKWPARQQNSNLLLSTLKLQCHTTQFQIKGG